jgi:salicylate hydroxylase
MLLNNLITRQMLREDALHCLKQYESEYLLSVRRPRASQIQNHTRKSVLRKSAEDIARFERYNWTYPGIHKALRQVKAGEPLI